MTFEGLSKKPKLIIFDLDQTLWPFDCIDYSYAELKVQDDKIYGPFGNLLKPYEESEAVLKCIKDAEIKIAIASSSASPRMGRKFIKDFNWEQYFDMIEIYPTEKTRHFKRLQGELDIDYKDMLFFDDLHFNIDDVKTLNVCCVHVEGGISMNLLRKGLEQFAETHNH